MPRINSLDLIQFASFMLVLCLFRRRVVPALLRGDLLCPREWRRERLLQTHCNGGHEHGHRSSLGSGGSGKSA